MDNNTLTAIVIGIFAVVIIAAILVFRNRVRAEVSGPFKTKLKLDASNPQPAPGASVEDAKSRGGGIRAEDQTGRGASVRRAEAERDIVATSRRQEGDADPKA